MSFRLSHCPASAAPAARWAPRSADVPKLWISVIDFESSKWLFLFSLRPMAHWRIHRICENVSSNAGTSFASNLFDSLLGTRTPAAYNSNFTHRFKSATHTYFQKVVYGCFSLTFWTLAARWYCVTVPQRFHSTAAGEVAISVLPVWEASGRVGLIDNPRLLLAAAACHSGFEWL